MRKALCFGAGNIGRGFIAQVCQESGIRLTFVDVNETLLTLLSEKQEYTIHLLDDEQTKVIIKNVDAIHSQDIDSLSQAIQEVDFVFTAVGPNVLKHVGATLAKIYEHNPHLTHSVIACENMVGGSSTLKEHVLSTCRTIPQNVHFLDAAVDRIVPMSQEAGSLDVKVEPSFEWIVETSKPLGLKDVIEVTDLEPYIKRKLLMVNGAHAFTAYLGLIYGYEMIDEAISNPEIEKSVRGLLGEHRVFLQHTFNLSEKDLLKMEDKVVKRFKNKLLQDDCVRVGRTPIRKLAKHERLSMGIDTLISLSQTPHYAYLACAAATLYSHDEEGSSLNKMSEQYLNQLFSTLDFDLESIKCILNERRNLLSKSVNH
jgi:mannitol-1-phosphate 5-dehydrogenase